MAKINLKQALASELSGLDSTDDRQLLRKLGMACMLLGQGASKQDLPTDFHERVGQIIDLASGTLVADVKVRESTLQHDPDPSSCTPRQTYCLTRQSVGSQRGLCRPCAVAMFVRGQQKLYAAYVTPEQLAATLQKNALALLTAIFTNVDEGMSYADGKSTVRCTWNASGQALPCGHAHQRLSLVRTAYDAASCDHAYVLKTACGVRPRLWQHPSFASSAHAWCAT